MPKHQDDDSTKIQRGTTAPTIAPEFSGQAYFEDSATGRCLRIAKGIANATDFVVACFVPQGHAGDPSGVKISRCAFDFCIDTVNDQLYFSTSANSTSWTLRVPGTGGGGGS